VTHYYLYVTVMSEGFPAKPGGRSIPVIQPDEQLSGEAKDLAFAKRNSA
jgi:hypothetical protein